MTHKRQMAQMQGFLHTVPQASEPFSFQNTWAMQRRGLAPSFPRTIDVDSFPFLGDEAWTSWPSAAEKRRRRREDTVLLAVVSAVACAVVSAGVSTFFSLLSLEPGTACCCVLTDVSYSFTASPNGLSILTFSASPRLALSLDPPPKSISSLPSPK